MLVRCLDSFDSAEALGRYEAGRLDRTSLIVRGSLENVSRYQARSWPILLPRSGLWRASLLRVAWAHATTGHTSTTPWACRFEKFAGTKLNATS